MSRSGLESILREIQEVGCWMGIGLFWLFSSICLIVVYVGDLRKFNRIKEKILLSYFYFNGKCPFIPELHMLAGAEDEETSSAGKVSKISCFVYITLATLGVYIIISKWSALPERELSTAVETSSSTCLAPLAQSSTYLPLPQGTSGKRMT